jgi:4'-phosphopantetheinyl transferase
MNTTIAAASKIPMIGIEVGPLREDEVHVWIASLDRRQSELSFFESILAEDEINRADRFHFHKDRDRFVAARGLLRMVLSCYVGVPPGEILFTYGAHGKPRLSQQHSRMGIQFNLAHSDGKAIYAITLNREVGVDIESIKYEIPFKDIAEHFFSGAELTALRDLPQEMQRIAFYKCWTRKEAFIKALGDGLSCPLADFDVSVMPGEPAKLLNVRWAPEEASRWFMKDIDAVPGFSAALVFSGSHCRMHVSQWHLNSGTDGISLQSIGNS